MYNKKFIITKDEDVANKLLAQKFKLISAMTGIYTFVNEVPANFTFDAFDVKKLHFTNQLHL